LGLHLECGYGEFPCVLAPGDFLFLYSSGVVDARNADGEPFGFARLERVLTTPVEEGARRIQAVTDTIREFAGGAWAGDRDAILIVVERMQGGAVPAEMQEA
jgi:serine phosphatase RsbU (regulator of sigma subunit)